MQRDRLREALAYFVPLLISAAVLAALGLVSVRAWSDEEGVKQGVFLCVGLAAMLAVQLVSYRDLLVISPILLGLSLLLVMYTVAGRFVTVPLVHETNRAWLWITVGPIKLQPSELVKIALIMVMAWFTKDESRRLHSFRTMLSFVALLGVSAGLIVMQPDLGTALTLIPPTFALMLLAGVKKRHLLALAGMGLAVAPVLWFSGTCATYGADCPLCPHIRVLDHLPQFVKHYQRARVQAMYSDDPRVLQDAGYQQERALQAIGSGGLMGKGMGTIPAARKIPEVHTDMIIALIGEQFGLLGIVIALCAYGLLIGTAAAVSGVTRDPAGRSLVVGITALLVGQAILNLAVALRLMPVTGVTLPFVSYGGSSLVASFAAIGLIANVARNQRKLMF